MPPAGFEPTIPASELPQTHALDRAATGIGKERINNILMSYENNAGGINHRGQTNSLKKYNYVGMQIMSEFHSHGR